MYCYIYPVFALNTGNEKWNQQVPGSCAQYFIVKVLKTKEWKNERSSNCRWKAIIGSCDFTLKKNPISTGFKPLTFMITVWCSNHVQGWLLFLWDCSSNPRTWNGFIAHLVEDRTGIVTGLNSVDENPITLSIMINFKIFTSSHQRILKQWRVTFWKTYPPGRPQPTTGSVEGAALTLGWLLIVRMPCLLTCASLSTNCNVSGASSSSFQGNSFTWEAAQQMYNKPQSSLVFRLVTLKKAHWVSR